MRCRTAGIALVGLLALGEASAAVETAIGRIKSAAGEATVVSGEQRRAATVGQPVYMREILETGADGALGVVFADESRLTLGADTSLTIDEYVFVPEHGDGSFITRMTRGSLLYVSGLIAKLKPESSVVETPEATIGIRGTRFLVSLEPVLIE